LFDTCRFVILLRFVAIPSPFSHFSFQWVFALPLMFWVLADFNGGYPAVSPFLFGGFVAACLASSSARSLPPIPSWRGIHTISSYGGTGRCRDLLRQSCTNVVPDHNEKVLERFNEPKTVSTCSSNENFANFSPVGEEAPVCGRRSVAPTLPILRFKTDVNRCGVLTVRFSKSVGNIKLSDDQKCRMIQFLFKTFAVL